MKPIYTCRILVFDFMPDQCYRKNQRVQPSVRDAVLHEQNLIALLIFTTLIPMEAPCTSFLYSLAGRELLKNYNTQ